MIFHSLKGLKYYMNSNKRKIGKVIAVVIIVILLLAIVIQVNNVKRDFVNVKKPTIETRKLSRLGIYKMMTVNETCRKYKISKEQVFEYLNIIPEQGDEKLTFLQLQKKYKKSHEEMKKGIRTLFDHVRRKGIKK